MYEICFIYQASALLDMLMTWYKHPSLSSLCGLLTLIQVHMSRTQLKPYYRGTFEKFVFLLQTIHIYVENTWAKFETISSMIRHTNKAKEKSRYIQEKQRILSSTKINGQWIVSKYKACYCSFSHGISKSE